MIDVSNTKHPSSRIRLEIISVFIHSWHLDRTNIKKSRLALLPFFEYEYDKFLWLESLRSSTCITMETSVSTLSNTLVADMTITYFLYHRIYNLHQFRSDMRSLCLDRDDLVFQSISSIHPFRQTELKPILTLDSHVLSSASTNFFFRMRPHEPW